MRSDIIEGWGTMFWILPSTSGPGLHRENWRDKVGHYVEGPISVQGPNWMGKAVRAL